MKINNGYNDPQTGASQAAERAQDAASSNQSRNAKSGASRSDEVNLSSLASAVQGALSDSPERAEHLESLAADFAAGRYQPGAAQTARALIDETLSAGPEKDKEK